MNALDCLNFLVNPANQKQLAFGVFYVVAGWGAAKLAVGTLNTIVAAILRPLVMPKMPTDLRKTR